MTNEEITHNIRSFIDDGVTLETGWINFRINYGIDHMSPAAQAHMQDAFISGAAFMYLAMTRSLSGKKQDDMRRLNALQAELNLACQHLRERFGLAERRDH